MRFHTLLLASAVFFSAAVASADLVVTPPDYGDCTLEKQQKTGEDCQECDGLYEATCEGKLKSQGYAQRCKIRSPGGWHEVWCKAPGGAEASSAPAEKSAAPAESKATESKAEKGAGCAVSGEGGSLAGLWIAALGLLFLRRRARR